MFGLTVTKQWPQISRSSTRINSLQDKWNQITASGPAPHKSQKRTGVVIVDHGSRRSAANEALNEFASVFRSFGSHEIVEIAHMELVEPTISQAITKCAEHGCTHIVVQPYFLSSGRHVTEDIPNIVADVAEEVPGVCIEIADPIGIDRLMAQIVDNRVKTAMAKFN